MLDSARPMASTKGGPDDRGDEDGMASELAVDRTLHFAHERFGLGLGASSPGWVRGRVLAVLKARSARLGTSLGEAATSLESDAAAIDALEKALRVGETRFYRDPIQWEAIEQHVLRTFPARTQINVLCAGCSTGEEAYTVAMLLKSARRRFHVLGADRSASAIAVARKGTYGPEAVREIPPVYFARFCEMENGILRVRAVLSEFVSFRECDLVQEIPTGPFHLIFFKNVMLYLPPPVGETVAGRLIDELDEGGLLFPAASEVLRLKNAGFSAARITPSVTAFRKSA